MATFEAEVTAWVRKSEARLLAVFRTAAQYLVEDVIERTPVDTGFLRASFTVTTDGPLPIRPDARPGGVWGNSYQTPPYALAIAGADLGDTLFGSFVAAYSAHVEFGARGRTGVRMVGLSVQRWQAHVNRASREAMVRVGTG